ncbi:MAG: hypothetical protein JOZ73_13125, partial [Solirubrobacterales bacterium]|nr:hypothetical protein [Solirubrobacterales bacterium]
MKLRGIIVVEDGVSRFSARHIRCHALEQIANQPIIEHVFEALTLADVEEVLIASSSGLSDAIRECLCERERREGPRIRYLQQQAPLELMDALRLAAPIAG